MYKISIYGCAMFKKLVCQWVKGLINVRPVMQSNILVLFERLAYGEELW